MRYRPAAEATRWIAVSLLMAMLQDPVCAQESVPLNMGMFFPAEMEQRDWNVSLGFVTLNPPEDISEEVRLRAPMGDVHALRRLGGGFYLDGRAFIQVVQNHFSVGARWVKPINKQLHVGLGDDVAYWRGHLHVAGFDTQSSGWMNYPSLSIGFRSRHDLLFTLKAELIISTARSFLVGEDRRSYDANLMSGAVYSIFMEQPFYKTKYVTLGLSLAYTDFMWATWALYETFDRKLLYPQITTGFIL